MHFWEALLHLLRQPEYGGVTDSADEAVKAFPAGILDYDAFRKIHIVEPGALLNIKSIAQIHMGLSLAELCDGKKMEAFQGD